MTQPPVFPDDPASVDVALAKARKAFNTHKSLDYKFRYAQLANLKKGLQLMHKELSTARTQDLGCDDFCNYITELHSCVRECEDALTNLRQWMKP